MHGPEGKSPGRLLSEDGPLSVRVRPSSINNPYTWDGYGRESSEPELAGPFEFPALPSVVSRTADDEQYHGARRWPENQQAS